MFKTLGQNHANILFALVAGMLPSCIWLWYWIKGDDVKPEPLGLIILTFIAGMIGVVLVLPIQKFFGSQGYDQTTQIAVWAACEEVMKFLAFYVIALRSSYIDEPIDFPIYMMTAALGFAALENTFFLLQPFSNSETTVALLTTNLRFLGSTLLHSVSSGFIGLMLGLSFFQNKTIKFGSLVLGFVLAIGLHTIFNFFIIQNDGKNFLQVFAFLWVVSIISILVFEKVRRMSIVMYQETIKRKYIIKNTAPATYH